MPVKRKIYFAWMMIMMTGLIAGFSMYMVSKQWIQTAPPRMPDYSVQVANGRSGQLYSPCAVLINRDTGEILMDMDGGERIYPASLTKIMTAIVAIEHTDDFTQKVTVEKNVFEDLCEKDASMAGFEPGEEVSLRDLLYGILLPSGAECCQTYARHVAGTEAAFVDLMNQKAEELGMCRTHFSNTTGLHEENHYTTAEDMAALLQYALSNETFREAFTSKTYDVEPTNIHPKGICLQSTLSKGIEEIKMEGKAMEAEMILGGKTGYTDEAGLCLASLAEISGQEYILVTAGAAGSHQTEPYNILDALEVYQRLLF
ncbi:D-alanyl-D-alanine carboxypeptidase family protein [Frisingicoccus sp.]|uniref:D-alanyl-D-alanine carboxypeptidase family protein n=1 Tax=Frisingicoccus sp. TaxID=1918627 RepID=UPI003AB65035